VLTIKCDVCGETKERAAVVRFAIDGFGLVPPEFENYDVSFCKECTGQATFFFALIKESFAARITELPGGWPSTLLPQPA
jgi:hypothetical protein